jgi:hypothetical protein
MEQHAIPRQITTFEFKLIGFMTLKQFIVLVVFGLVALLVYFVFQGHIIGILLSILILGAGAAVALLPIQDRYIDEWARLLLKGLNSQTQYIYDKRNKTASLYYLHDLYFTEDPHRVMAHIESKEKLNAYLAAQREQKQKGGKRKQHVQSLMQHSTKQLQARQFQPSLQNKQAQTAPSPPSTQTQASPQASAPSSGPQTPLHPPASSQPAPRQSAPSQPAAQQMKHPFFTGLIKNNRRIPLPGILVYIKDAQDNPIRILKTNPHGVFATYSPLPPGTYNVEIKDPNEQYFFDRMNIDVGTSNPTPYEFQSREML